MNWLSSVAVYSSKYSKYPVSANYFDTTKSDGSSMQLDQIEKINKIMCPKLGKITLVIFLIFCCLPRAKGCKWLPYTINICVFWK